MAEWLETENRRLRALWDEGLSTSEIGRQMGRTKNAIVGRAHRLELPDRPSPIVRDGPKTLRSIHENAARRRRQHEATLGTLPSLHERLAADSFQAGIPEPHTPVGAAARMPRDDAESRKATKTVLDGGPAVAVAAKPPVAATPRIPADPCCWPIGDVGTRAFRFCDAQSAPGRPYCKAHCDIAYIRVSYR